MAQCHNLTESKVCYDSLWTEQKSNLNTNLFQERFKELDNLLDISVLQTKQDKTESVGDF